MRSGVFSLPENPRYFASRGVGKTYAWNQYLRNARAAGKVGLEHYSYVSLFGINSLDDFKYSIFENVVKSFEEGVEPGL